DRERADSSLRTGRQAAALADAELLVERPGKHGQYEIAEGDAVDAVELAAENVRNDERGVLVELAQTGRRGVGRHGHPNRAGRRVGVEERGELERGGRLAHDRRRQRGAPGALEDAADREPGRLERRGAR